MIKSSKASFGRMMAQNNKVLDTLKITSEKRKLHSKRVKRKTTLETSEEETTLETSEDENYTQNE